jgi:hypothetical protein
VATLLDKRKELDEILEHNDESGQLAFDKWLVETKQLLPEIIVRKLNRITTAYYTTRQNDLAPWEIPKNEEWIPYFYEFNSQAIDELKAIIDDELYKILPKKIERADMEKLKLLKAREENFGFETRLAEMICGDNAIFPYKSSSYITEFFAELGLPWVHDGSTRKFWIADRLKTANIHIIHKIIVVGLFKKKYFQAVNEAGYPIKDIESAKNEFKKVIDESISSNEVLDLSELFGLNIKNELLFNKKTETADITLNELVDKSKELFTKGDKQVAIEKLWDAFERCKTLLDVDKKVSVNKILNILSSQLDNVFLENEFTALTQIGNDYQIRHHEISKKPIGSDVEREYLFFRMLSLIDFTLTKLTIAEDTLSIL